MNKGSLLTIVIIFASSSWSFETLAKENNVSSTIEKQNAIALGVKGPTETHGIESEVLAMVDLGREFDAMQAYSLRSRRISVAPGGVIAVHQHQSRPGIVYVLEGEMTEHRNDSDVPVTLMQDDVSTEVHGLIHWWTNDGAEAAVVYVVDIVVTP